jgi:hypothetical protein
LMKVIGNSQERKTAPMSERKLNHREHGGE